MGDERVGVGCPLRCRPGRTAVREPGGTRLGARDPPRGFAAFPGAVGPGAFPALTQGCVGNRLAPEQVLRGRSPPPRSAQPRSAGGSVPAAPAGDHESPVTRGQGAAGDLIANGGAMTPGAASDPTFNS